jgi:hypothetical protein
MRCTADGGWFGRTLLPNPRAPCRTRNKAMVRRLIIMILRRCDSDGA